MQIRRERERERERLNTDAIVIKPVIMMSGVDTLNIIFLLTIVFFLAFTNNYNLLLITAQPALV